MFAYQKKKQLKCVHSKDGVVGGASSLEKISCVTFNLNYIFFDCAYSSLLCENSDSVMTPSVCIGGKFHLCQCGGGVWVYYSPLTSYYPHYQVVNYFHNLLVGALVGTAHSHFTSRVAALKSQLSCFLEPLLTRRPQTHRTESRFLLV